MLVAMEGMPGLYSESSGRYNDIFPETLAVPELGGAKIECEHPPKDEQVLGANATEIFFTCGACGFRWKEDR